METVAQYQITLKSAYQSMSTKPMSGSTEPKDDNITQESIRLDSSIASF